MGKINIIVISGFLASTLAQASVNDQYNHIECFSVPKNEIESSENKMIYNGRDGFSSVLANIDTAVDFRTQDSAIVRVTDTKKNQDVLFSTQFNEDGLFQAESYSLKTIVTCHKF